MGRNNSSIPGITHHLVIQYSPENVQMRNIMQSKHITFRVINLHIYTCMHIIIIAKNRLLIKTEDLNLKERNMEGFGGRKGKGKLM